MVNAIIMASGLSLRMGNNKLLLDYNNKPIIEHVLIEISKCSFNEVIVVSQYEEVIALGNKYNYKTIKNDNPYIGQSESIKLGINNSSKCDGFMFFVGDQPKVKSEHIEKIIKVFKENKENIIIPTSKNKSGNPVIFPYSKKNDLLSLNKDEKGKKIIKQSNNIKYVNVSEEIFFDIDTKEDYKRLRGESNETDKNN
ncbi:MAG: molybdenum cofactor cytidylyltransferase [Peptostreptococcaceae bacterium]